MQLLAAAVISMLAGSFSTAEAQEFTLAPPEVKQLAFWEGHWATTGKVNDDKGNVAAEVTGTMDCEFFSGGHHIVCRSEDRHSDGLAVRSMNIYSYDSTRKVYLNYLVADFGGGVTAFSTMSLEGNIWRGATDQIFASGGGRVLKQVRTTITQNSPTSFTTKPEGTFDGVNWFPMGETSGSKAPKP